LFSCSTPDRESVLPHPVDNLQIIDSIAIGNTRFGIDRKMFLSTLVKPPVENRMTEPKFHELTTEVELPITVGAFTYQGYYYFDKKDRLYKVHLQYQNEKRLVKADYNEAYENLYDDFKTKYGPGTSLKTMPGLKSVTWNFKNKKVELTGSCLASNCSMECNIIEINMFRENTPNDRVRNARLQLELKMHPENF